MRRRDLRHHLRRSGGDDTPSRSAAPPLRRSAADTPLLKNPGGRDDLRVRVAEAFVTTSVATDDSATRDQKLE
jgi:hypothetical protein